MWNYNFYTYILSNDSGSVVYIGFTNNLRRRVYEHKTKLTQGFTKRYNIPKLVYFEHYTDIELAISREKQLKKWKRNWKNELITKMNPIWRDLYEELG